MKKFFYQVEFTYTFGSKQSTLDLGIFATKKKAFKKVDMSKNLSGFKIFSNENFKITKFGVDFDYHIIDKGQVKLFLVWHEYIDQCDETITHWTIIGYFSNLKEAEEQVIYFKQHNRLGKRYPNNFQIDEVSVDNYNSWSEGFNLLS